MACKLPVVQTRQCNFDEVGSHGAGWVGKPTADSLADCLDASLSISASERKTIGQRGYDLVRRQYRWGLIAQKLERVYEWMLGGGLAPSNVRRAA